MSDSEDNKWGEVDVSRLDLETIRAVKHSVRGFPETNASPVELDDYRTGRHDAFSGVMAMLSEWERMLEESSDDK